MSEPILDWGERILFAGRTEDMPWRMYYWDVASETFKPLAIAADDHVRFKLAREDGTVVLDLDSIGATVPGGSVVEITIRGTLDSVPASGHVRFGQADTLSLSASYDGVLYKGCELALVDNSETAPADAIKVFGRGTIRLKGSPGGDVGIT